MKPSIGETQGETHAFKRFDLVTDDASDNYFAGRAIPSGKDGNLELSSATSKKIMHEWMNLEFNLPDSIFVRGYERRMDLLRAVIVGAAGTPYHDGLFFFDILIPADYPNQPPKVHYHSYGLQLNPNLYSNGYVCLSLLNTWMGKLNERWNPQISSLLQVLISLQALVLNQKPSYNEPTIKIFPGKAIKEKISLAYNEHVFVLSCKTMLFLLQRPPKHFDQFVAEHFRERAPVILTACKLYRDGHLTIGSYTGSSSSSSSSCSRVSVTFKTRMDELYPKLVRAFHKNGASVGNFIEQLQAEEEKGTSLSQPSVKRDGILKRAVSKIKAILGLKKDRHGREDKIKRNS